MEADLGSACGDLRQEEGVPAVPNDGWLRKGIIRRELALPCLQHDAQLEVTSMHKHLHSIYAGGKQLETAANILDVVIRRMRHDW